jgi:hypothetical protein
MEYHLTTDDISLLRRIAAYLSSGENAYAMNAIYISPAQQLRNQADRMEQEAADKTAYEALLSRLQ